MQNGRGKQPSAGADDTAGASNGARTSRDALERAVTAAGGVAALAAATGLKERDLRRYAETGHVPMKEGFTIERETGIACEDLCPEISSRLLTAMRTLGSTDTSEQALSEAQSDVLHELGLHLLDSVQKALARRGRSDVDVASAVMSLESFRQAGDLMLAKNYFELARSTSQTAALLRRLKASRENAGDAAT